MKKIVKKERVNGEVWRNNRVNGNLWMKVLKLCKFKDKGWEGVGREKGVERGVWERIFGRVEIFFLLFV